ncbi:MAG TPA: ABC transporter ATP-binding protein, partial [Woeseiaceae bacterium]
APPSLQSPMMGPLRRTFALLSARERRKLAWLLGAMVFTGLLDVVGISSIFPFMAVAARPESIESSKVLSYLYHFLGFTSNYRFLFGLGVAVLCLIVLGNTVTALMTAMMLRFAHNTGHALSCRILTDYFHKPYAFFLSRNSITMTVVIIEEVAGLVHGVVLPALQTAAKAIVTLFILILLLAVDPLLALIVASGVISAYLLMFRMVRRRLQVIGVLTSETNRARHKTVSEVLSGIKDFKILGRARYMLERFQTASRDHAKYQALHGAISALPRYAIESIAFGSILLILLYLLAVRRDVTQALPLIALYAVAGYRLMPAVQQIFGGVAHIRFSLSCLGNLHRELQSLAESPGEDDGAGATAVPIRFESAVELRTVSYRYPGAHAEALDDVDLLIQKNTTVGIVGPTGSGKTTLVDILLGLLVPTRGTVLVDGVELTHDNMRAWRSRMGYVPQHIYLADDSIFSNIAFGLSPRQIDVDRVRHAARLANLDDFIERELPRGYDTQVGERGIRLSGGQRQRIGIARALYHDPDVLIFDEATSALDGITEDVIINAIRSLARRKTIVLIAHRFSTIRDCDVIYMLENGSITDSGSYSELSERSLAFRDLGKVMQGEPAAITRVGNPE